MPNHYHRGRRERPSRPSFGRSRWDSRPEWRNEYREPSFNTDRERRRERYEFDDRERNRDRDDWQESGRDRSFDAGPRYHYEESDQWREPEDYEQDEGYEFGDEDFEDDFDDEDEDYDRENYRRNDDDSYYEGRRFERRGDRYGRYSERRRH